MKEIITPSRVVFLNAATKREAIESLVARGAKEGLVTNQELFLHTLETREALLSTGIGLGVAVPHARMKGIADFFVITGIQKGNGIDWQALDGGLVRLIFLIGGPATSHSDYLAILSKITTRIKDPEVRKNLLMAENEEQVVAVYRC